jgi:hypothetical protein
MQTSSIQWPNIWFIFRKQIANKIVYASLSDPPPFLAEFFVPHWGLIILHVQNVSRAISHAVALGDVSTRQIIDTNFFFLKLRLHRPECFLLAY